MKKYYAMLVALLAGCIFASCTKLRPAPRSTTVVSIASIPKKTTGDTTTGNHPVVPIDPNLLVGNWRVVNDTSTTEFWGIWAGKPATGSNYMGQPADYYQFTASGKCYRRINGVVDTSDYTVNQNKVHVVFTFFAGKETTTGIFNSTWTVSNLTTHTCAVTAMFVTPETAVTSVTNLAKN